jgi:predicted DNA-binding antitoxin AbrB/MazE fold protein
MSQIQAVFQGGVFRPLEPVDVMENQRVVLDVRPAHPDVWAEADALRERLRQKYGVFPDSTPEIAEDRMRDV